MILIKKALRSMLVNKKAYFACILLIVVGVMLFVSMQAASEKLTVSKDDYYSEYRLADVFGSAKAIPHHAYYDFMKIDGISDVNLRLVTEGRVSIPGNDKQITMRLVSLNLNDENPINGVMVKGGNLENSNDIMVSPSFLQVHGYSIGDSFDMIINGKIITFDITATAESPEYVYIVKEATDILPDPETFSIGYMSVENMQTLLNKQGAYNDVCFMLNQGYTFDDVKIQIEDILNNYGSTSLYPQKDLVSFSILDMELVAISSMSVSTTLAFVSLAMIVLYLMLKRVIEMDRAQIGMMKAFGYSNAKIVIHYMFFGIIIGAVGGLIGAVTGFFIAGVLGDVYNEYFMLPSSPVDVTYVYMIQGFSIAVLGGMTGAFMGAKSVIKLLPAESMRPVAPKIYKFDIIKALPPLKFILNSGGNMAVRSIIRSPVRSMLVVVGIMFSFGMLAFMGSYNDLMDSLLMNQFTKIQLYDSKIVLKNPVNMDEATETVIRADGVYLTEPLLELPVVLHHDYIREGVVITGIAENSDLYKIYDNELRETVSPPKGGILLSSSISDKLNASAGDVLLVESNVSEEKIPILVTGVVTQNLGANCYMELTSLQNMFSIGSTVSSIIVKTDNSEYLSQWLFDAENVTLVDDKQKNMQKYNDFFAMYDSVIYMLIGVAIVVAFAIIYNTTTISLSERKREYATLRVLGMQIPQVAAIISFEYWLLCIAGVLAGIPFTMLLKHTIAIAFETDFFTFPPYTPFSAYLLAAAGCALAVLFSNRSTVKNIKLFDMVEVLKERE